MSARGPLLPDLTGLVAVVTGASGTLGHGIAEQFAEAGCRVVVHHRGSADRARDLAAAITRRGGAAHAVAADLTEESGGDELITAALDRFGRVDALVNNAGTQPVQALAAMSAADWRAVVDTNLTSAFLCTRAAARAMCRAGTGGTITHIASIEGSAPAPGHAHYAASKAALIMHARAAALEYGPHGIRVNTVSPGLIHRPGLEEDWPEGVARYRGAAPLGRLGTPADVGRACVFLASPMAEWISGHDLVVDGGVMARPTW
ncbi:SDR family NAD(P)-dependent oxidoreductase [Streptomyces sp. URMC 123]|uniref:SDR family NAD(P)-dependent oxidoreductase n=1 Tax=Streptomyces sp. URMC 123 TaxID=3423403 RepID=UPI003F1A6662